MKWFVKFLAALVLVVLVIEAGQIAYTLVVDHRRERFEEQFVRNTEGTREGCEAYTVERGDDAVLFIHGFADSPVLFRKMVSFFGDAGITCRVMLLPGFAKTVEVQASTTWLDWERAVNDEIQGLRAAHSNVWIIAHSLGCAVALPWMLDHPDGVRGAFFLAPLIEVSKRRSLFVSPFIWYSISRRLFSRIDYVENPMPLDVACAFDEDSLPKDRFIHFSIYAALFDLVDEVKKCSGSITVPVVVYQAAHDRVVNNEVARRIISQTHKNRVTFKVMDKSAHLLPLDYEWRDICLDILHRIRKEENETG